MHDPKYYLDKKRRIEQKFEQKKNNFLQNLFNIVNTIQAELTELKLEHEEVSKEENSAADEKPNDKK